MKTVNVKRLSISNFKYKNDLVDAKTIDSSVGCTFTAGIMYLGMSDDNYRKVNDYADKYLLPIDKLKGVDSVLFIDEEIGESTKVIHEFVVKYTIEEYDDVSKLMIKNK